MAGTPGGSAEALGRGASAPDQSDRCALLSLPPEVLANIMTYLTPTEPMTPLQSPPFRHHLSTLFREEHINSRIALANLCRVSWQLRSWATGYLYKTVLLETLEQLASFFFSIANSDANRTLVHTFAWYDRDRRRSVLYRHVTIRPSKNMTREATAWPRSSTDRDIARIMGIQRDGTAPGWRILGAVLGMLPEIRALFYALRTSRIVGSLSLYQCPEEEALLTLLGEPVSKRFLQNLQTVILGPGRRQSRKWIQNYLFNSLAFLLHNSTSSLRRIELSHLARLRSYSAVGRGGVDAIRSQVQELLLLDFSYPSCTVEWAVSAFPKLTTLVVECKEDSSHGLGVSHMPLSDFDAFQGLRKLSGTLETLSLTSARQGTWSNRRRIADRSSFHVPPLLTGLFHMACLKYLTTESIWIFGINNRAVDPRFMKFLPASLECLRLLDFWGVSSGYPYYPDTLGSWNGLWFYDQAFSEIRGSSPTRCPRLRDITIALLPDIVAHNTVVAHGVTPKVDNYGRPVPEDIPSFTKKYQELFAEIGISFTNITPDEFRMETRADWELF